MKILQRGILLVVLLVGIALPVFAQPRTVVRTNQRGQIVRLTVSTNNRILRQEVIGSIDYEEVAAPQPVQQQRRRAVVEQPPQEEEEEETEDVSTGHFIGLSLDFIVQNANGLSRLSVQTDPANVNTAYGAQIPFFGDNIGLGGGATITYMYAFPSFLTIHSQLEINTTGWIFSAFNLGLGARVPVGRMFFITDAAFSLGMTGATLPRVTGIVPIDGTPDELLALLVLFGFRARIGVQFQMTQNSFFTLYTSYAAYPWGISTASGETRVNDTILGQSIIQDAFKVGFEFSWRITSRSRSRQEEDDGYDDDGY